MQGTFRAQHLTCSKQILLRAWGPCLLAGPGLKAGFLGKGHGNRILKEKWAWIPPLKSPQWPRVAAFHSGRPNQSNSNFRGMWLWLLCTVGHLGRILRQEQLLGLTGDAQGRLEKAVSLGRGREERPQDRRAMQGTECVHKQIIEFFLLITLGC